MKLEDILTLAKAGYTREEIAKMDTPEPPAETVIPPIPDQKPGETPATPPAKDPEPEPEKDSGNVEIMGAINALTAAIQKMNVQNATIPGGDEELTPEDMIASIINPPLKPKGGK